MQTHTVVCDIADPSFHFDPHTFSLPLKPWAWIMDVQEPILKKKKGHIYKLLDLLSEL